MKNTKNVWKHQKSSRKCGKDSNSSMERIVSSVSINFFSSINQYFLVTQKYKLRAATMKQAMEILKQSSFGGLILNSKNEVMKWYFSYFHRKYKHQIVFVQILAVQNYCGTWSALKGHLKIKENDELETPWEAFLRELLEELSIRHTSVELTENNINKFITMNQEIYFECHVLNNRDDNHRIRRIGLFFICIDENNLQFNLADNKENQVIVNLVFVFRKNQVFKMFDFLFF